MGDKAKQVPTEIIKGTQFALFGLGNSRSFPERYQSVGKHLTSRLQQLGAQLAFPRGEGDDSGSIEMDFDQWKNMFLNALENDALVLSKSKQNNSTKQPEQQPASSKKKLNVSLVAPTDAPSREHVRMLMPTEAIKASNPTYNTVQQVTNLCPSSARTKKSLMVDAQNTPYEHGDHVGVWPQNDPQIVQQFAKRCNLQLQDLCMVSSNSADLAAPFVSTPSSALSLRTILSEYYDLNGSLTPSVIKALSELATNKSEQAQLQSMAQGDTYVQQVKEQLLNMVDLLHMFPSIQFPQGMEQIMPLLPKMTPRYYSISSSPRVHPTQMRLTFGTHVITRPQQPQLPFKGICSHYLDRVQEQDKLGMFVRTSQFRLPKDYKQPIICVCGGTGYVYIFI